jgi:hypothetical protein
MFKFRLGHILAAEFRGCSQLSKTNIGNMPQPLLSNDIRQGTAANLLETHFGSDVSVTQLLNRLSS